MSSIVVAGDTSGSITLQAPAVAGSRVLTLPTATGTLVDTTTISASTGSTLVGTTNGGTGAVTRTVASKLNDTVSAKDFGVVGDGVTNDSTALLNATNSALLANNMLGLSGVSYAPSLPLSKSTDILYEGNLNALKGAYRKNATPIDSPSDYVTPVNINPNKHLRSLNLAAKPIVVLVGDSISTYSANSNSRSDMLAEVLRRTIDEQFPSGITFYDRAISGSVWGSYQNVMYDSRLPWYTISTLSGLQTPWSSTTTYQINMFASLGGVNYQCILACTNITPPNATYWTVMSAWSSVTSYVAGNLVSYGGLSYKCILACTNITPPNATYWTCTTTWRDVVRGLNPDLVIFSWGMNEGGAFSVNSMQQSIDYVQTWTKVPSIVVCTNLVSTAISASVPDTTNALAEGRDTAAGINRSYAKYRNLGVIDIHRKATMARDGFDPTSSVLKTGDTIAAIYSSGANTSTATGSTLCHDFKAMMYFDSAPIIANTQVLNIKYGSNVNDRLIIAYTSGNSSYTFALTTGTGSDYLTLTPVVVTTPLTSGVGWWLTVEKSGDYITVYNESDSLTGGANDPIMHTKCVSAGALFYPYVQSVYGNCLQQVIFKYGEQRVNNPSIKTSLLWGQDPAPSGGNLYGGNGYHHPSGLIATHVYRPLIQSIQWYSQMTPSGTVAIASAATSAVVSLPSAELDTSYNITLDVVGADIGQRFWISAKTTTTFTITLSAGATNATSIFWKLLRNY